MNLDGRAVLQYAGAGMTALKKMKSGYAVFKKVRSKKSKKKMLETQTKPNKTKRSRGSFLTDVKENLLRVRSMGRMAGLFLERYF